MLAHDRLVPVRAEGGQVGQQTTRVEDARVAVFVYRHRRGHAVAVAVAITVGGRGGGAPRGGNGKERDVAAEGVGGHPRRLRAVGGADRHTRGAWRGAAELAEEAQQQ